MGDEPSLQQLWTVLNAYIKEHGTVHSTFKPPILIEREL